MADEIDKLERLAKASTDAYVTTSERLGRMEEQLRGIELALSEMRGANLAQTVRDNKTAVDGLEVRVRKQEDYTSNLTGRLVVIGALVSFVTVIVAGVISAAVVKVLVK